MSNPDVLKNLEINFKENTIEIQYSNKDKEYFNFKSDSQKFNQQIMSLFKSFVNGDFDPAVANNLAWSNKFYSAYIDILNNDLNFYKFMSNFRRENPSLWEYSDSQILSDYISNTDNSKSLEKSILSHISNEIDNQTRSTLKSPAHGFIADISYKQSESKPFLPEIQKIVYSNHAKGTEFSDSEIAYIQKHLQQQGIVKNIRERESNQHMNEQLLKLAAKVVNTYDNYLKQGSKMNDVKETMEKLNDYVYLNANSFEENSNTNQLLTIFSKEQLFSNEDSILHGANQIYKLFDGNNPKGYPRKTIEKLRNELPIDMLTFEEREIARIKDWKNQFTEELPNETKDFIDNLSVESLKKQNLNVIDVYSKLPPSIKEYALENNTSFEWTTNDTEWKKTREVSLDNDKSKDQDVDSDQNTKNKAEIDISLLEAKELGEHALQLIKDYTTDPKDFSEYLDFMSKFYQYSPRNVALIQKQWQGANQVATFDQWKQLGKDLSIGANDVEVTTRTFTNKKTKKETTITLDSLSVKAGEKAQITLFRPLMMQVIPKVDKQGNVILNEHTKRPETKPYKYATKEDKELIKKGKIKVSTQQLFKNGYPQFGTYKVFEISQTNLKPEAYPKAMPNRPEMYSLKDPSIVEGLTAGIKEFSTKIGVQYFDNLTKDTWDSMKKGNVKGFFTHDPNNPNDRGKIIMNPRNHLTENVSVAFHELAHAVMHNGNQNPEIKKLPTPQKELEAELSSYIVSKHFGIDTEASSISYVANWTNKLKNLDDTQLASSLKRVHNTSASMIREVENTVNKVKQNINLDQKQNKIIAHAPSI